MAQRLEDLVIRLTADNSELRRALASSQAEIRAFSRQSSQQFSALTTATRGLAAAFAAVGGAAVFKSAIDASLKLGDSLQNTSERIGVTAEELQRLQAAAEPAGTSADVLSSALLKLSKTVAEARSGSGTLVKALKDTRPELLASLQGANNAADAFLILSDTIAGIEDPIERARIGSAAFGRSWGEVVNVLALGREEIEAAGDRAERLGRIIGNDAVKALDDFGDTLADIKRVSLAQFAEGLVTSATSAESLTDALGNEESIRQLGEAARVFGELAGAILRVAQAFPEAIRLARNSIPLWREIARLKGLEPITDQDIARLTGDPFFAVSGSASSTAGPFANVIGGSSTATAGAVARAGGSRGRSPRVGSGGGGGGGGRSSAAGPRIEIDTSRILIEPLEDFKKFNDELLKEMDTTIREVDTSVDEALRVSADRAQFFGDFLGSVFRDFAEDGKLNLKELVFSFGQAIVEMEIRAAASKLFGMSSSGSAGASGLFGGIFSSLLGAIGFAEGGIVTRPTLAMIGEGGEAEAVIPLSKLRGSAGGAVVNIVNQGAPLDVVSQSRRRTADGDQIDVTVRNAWRRSAARAEFRDALGQRHQPGVG